MLLSWLPLFCPLSLPSPPRASQAPHSLSRAALSSANGWNLPGGSQSFSTEFPSKCVYSRLVTLL